MKARMLALCQPSGFGFRRGRCRTAFRAKTHPRAPRVMTKPLDKRRETWGSAVPHWSDHGPVFTPRSSNRIGRFPASGLYGAFIVKGASRHFGRPLHSILLFDPRREHSSRPHISIAVARSGSQGRRFFSAAEGLSLTDASTAAGCRRSGGWPRDDPRGACHWPRSIARTTLVFG